MVWITVLFTVTALQFSDGGVPLFIRGRPKGGLLGLPNVDQTPEILPEENWFTQRLNHFNDADLRTWKQRYFYNASFFNSSNGPVFLMVGGEGEANPIWLTVGSMVKYAEQFGALCFYLEHRFYGKSHPLNDMTDESLQYLSSEQALADLADFRQAMVAKFNLNQNNKWIAFGGSYPGALAAWFRLKYPHLVIGSIASSAPVQAQLDFPQYMEVATAALATTGEQCVENIAAATKMVQTMVLTGEGLQNLSKTFRLCKPLQLGKKLDISNFATSLSGNFMGVVQYNKDNRAFEGAKGTNITIDTLCGLMNQQSIGDALSRYAAVNKLIMDTYGLKCLDVDYTDFVSSMRKTSWESSAAEGGRQWMYQTCTEFGYYQTSDSSKQPFGNLFPLSFSIQQCMDIFGPQFNETNINRGIDRTNTNYGGFGLSSSKIVFPNGSIDPWHALSLTTDVSSSVIAIFITGTAHCANMYPATPNDLPQLVKAREQIQATISTWLKECL